jgi:hypothetical protein
LVVGSQTIHLRDGSFISNGVDIDRFMKRVHTEDFVLSLYIPLYKIRSRKCGYQRFYQSSSTESGLHVEISHIIERKKKYGDDSFHKGLLLVGNSTSSIPISFKNLLYGGCVSISGHFDIQKCCEEIILLLSEMYSDQAIAQYVNSFKNLEFKPSRGLVCSCDIQNEEEFVVSNTNKVVTVSQMLSEFIWGNIYRSVNNEMRGGNSTLINLFGPDYIGKKQMLYSLARRWEIQYKECGYKIIWFINGVSQRHFDNSCDGLCKAFWVNELSDIREKTLLILFDVKTTKDTEKFLEKLPSRSNLNFKIIVL